MGDAGITVVIGVLIVQICTVEKKRQGGETTTVAGAQSIGSKHPPWENGMLRSAHRSLIGVRGISCTELHHIMRSSCIDDWKLHGLRHDPRSEA